MKTVLTIPRDRKYYLVDWARHEIGPSYTLDVLMFSDERQLATVRDTDADYPIGDITVFVSGAEQWVMVTDDQRGNTLSHVIEDQKVNQLLDTMAYERMDQSNDR